VNVTEYLGREAATGAARVGQLAKLIVTAPHIKEKEQIGCNRIVRLQRDDRLIYV
jgi:hypothetical protein